LDPVLLTLVFDVSADDSLIEKALGQTNLYEDRRAE
jgi:hypothetical protein